MFASGRNVVKICGVTTPGDIDLVHAAGADAVGINVWPQSPRAVSAHDAQALVEYARGRLATVLVTVDETAAQLRCWLDEVRPDYLQLHGNEPDALVTDFAPHAYKAIGIASSADVARALVVPGDVVLIDTHDARRRGGTGQPIAGDLDVEVCRARRCMLAGGLRVENVRERILRAHPWGVDVASGVECAPGRKDAELVLAFVRAARQAWQELREGEHV
ncbi:MAG: phosphoribosylanthranilate isomerase [Myxococcota bacterium]